MLQCSPNTLLEWAKKGLLHPVTVRRVLGNGHPYDMLLYDPEEIANLPRMHRMAMRKTPGDVAARAFEMFTQGDTLSDVVIATCQTPDEVDELHRRWIDMNGARLMITPSVKADLEEILGGTFSTCADLVALARTRVPVLEHTQPVEIQEPVTP